jgi:hypothetical protein
MASMGAFLTRYWWALLVAAIMIIVAVARGRGSRDRE